MRLTQIFCSTAQMLQRFPKYNPVKKFFRVTHCLFDLDGTLLDTHRYYEYSCDKIFKKYGQQFTPKWYAKMLQLSSKDFWREVYGEYHLRTSWTVLEKECQDIYMNYIDGAPLKPGAEKLVHHLHSSKVPIAVVTSSNKEVTEWKTKHIKDFMGLFKHIICADGNKDVKQWKPRPDVYLVCASRFFEKPVNGNCLVFEDTPRGIDSAIAAGMQCVAIPSQSVPHQMCNNATVIINSFAEFHPGMFGLPLFAAPRNTDDNTKQ